VSSLVTFRLGLREFATSLVSVREVVRLQGLADLPGMTAPTAGVIEVRGVALPVVDLRPDAGPDGPGDVLVMERPSQQQRLVGVAVDQVRAVIDSDEFPLAGAPGGDEALPAYVLAVLRGPHGVVFLVDLPTMVGARVPA
jgi:chemotaxis signal transduction protein